MDARSLFVIVAITFLLWLVRTWIRWDSQVKRARHSSQQLRNRLIDATLSSRVGNRHSSALLATDSIQSTDQARGTDSDTGNRDEAADLAQLRKQLEQAQQQAAAAEQNDLELRRLRGELESLQVERADAAKRIEELELRIREQQTALDASADTASQSGAEGRRASTTEGGQTAQTPPQVTVPLYDAPLERDNLKQINGIGPVMERTLNELGVTTFQQLADFTQVDIDKVSEAIGAFPERIERDDWVGKAQQILRKDRRHA